MNSNLIYIRNKDICVGISADIGGSIFYLSKHTSGNLLHTNEALWDSKNKPEVTPHADFVPYNGHTIWLGPQSEWWNQQTANPERKKEKAVWPPDPFITYGTYTVENKTESSICLVSPESPVSGVQIRKEIAVNPDGSVFQSIHVTNISNEERAWDIWFNTRVHGYARAYVPAKQENIRTEHVQSQTSTEMPLHVKDNFFYYSPQDPPNTHTERSSKTFIHPETPDIYAFLQEHCLHIQFEKHSQTDIHPEHALVEIYNRTEKETENSLLELEYHAPYKRLSPGETMSAWQVWNILEHSLNKIEQEHISFISKK